MVVAVGGSLGSKAVMGSCGRVNVLLPVVAAMVCQRVACAVQGCWVSWAALGWYGAGVGPVRYRTAA